MLSRPADEGNGLPVKRRRVTAEMEGKYIINMPKGTTARTARILAQQAKKGRASPTGQGEPRILIIQPPLIIIPLILWTAASKGNWSWNVFISYPDKDDPYPSLEPPPHTHTITLFLCVSFNSLFDSIFIFLTLFLLPIKRE